MEHFVILGVRISATTISSACEAIEGLIRRKEKTYVCVAPVSTLVDCRKSENYRNIVNSAGMVTPDGMPVVWLGRLSGNTTVQRTYGPDLMAAVCERSQDGGYRHFFYGGTPETNERLVGVIRRRFPRLSIAGTYVPPFRAGGEQEDAAVIAQINAAQPDIVWVGLGSPKQDYWMAAHRPVLNAPVLIGVGAAFDFLAGTKRQAPVWMRRSGLEWLFRLLSEPRRLWKRYLVGNTQFIWYLIKDIFGGKRHTVL
jgi:N-acetylglucosaminyldiphosphoundecaprenol N-acetyl-beta-D-mannosaminyltransferase